MNDKFTILTSSYNCGKYLKDWSKSVLAQKYRPLEIIFVNDKSTDRTANIISKLATVLLDDDIDIKILTNEKRRYCGTSYNKALSFATGKYFGVLDADDSLKKESVQYICDLYQKYPEISWIYTQFSICNMSLKHKKRGWCKAPPKGKSLLSLKEQHAFSHWRTFSDRIERKDKIFKKGLRCAIDKYMGYRLEEMGKGMFASRVCYRYRQRYSCSISTSEKTKSTWSKIRKEAAKRRKLYSYNVYPIMTYKDNK